jgi:hypothetical protein
LQVQQQCRYLLLVLVLTQLPQTASRFGFAWLAGALEEEDLELVDLLPVLRLAVTPHLVRLLLMAGRPVELALEVNRGVLAEAEQ